MRLIDADAFMKKLAYIKYLNARCPLEKEQLEDKEVNNYDLGQDETFELVMEHLEKQPTAYDVDKIINQLEELTIKELGIDKEKFKMDEGEYSSYCSLSLYDVKRIVSGLLGNGKR